MVHQSFLVEDAILYGLNEAVILNHIRCSLDKGKARVQDGLYWVDIGYTEMQHFFPYLSHREVDYSLHRLVCMKAIERKNEIWFTIPSEFLIGG